MAFATIASIASIAAAAAGLASMGYQAAKGAPQIPSGASASREIAQAQANALPEQRALAAAEQQGISTPMTIPAHKEKTQMAFVPNTRTQTGPNGNTSTQITGGGKWVPYKASDWTGTGQYASLGQPRLKNQNVMVPETTKTENFQGYGTADVEGKLAGQMADIQQQLGAKYGIPFAEEAKREAELADPQGTAARKMEYDLIQKELNNPTPVNPLSSTLENQVDAQLKAGAGLDPQSQDVLNSALARANADRAGGVAPEDVATSMMTGAEGEARRQAAIQKAQGFLSSGSSPADIQYRREQQNLANLSSFVGGRTPESQFQQLSGASQGTTPLVGAQQAPTMPGGASQLGGEYSVAGYQAGTKAASTPNPWMAGISSLLSSVSGLGKAIA
jgi:hypothetical protein